MSVDCFGLHTEALESRDDSFLCCCALATSSLDEALRAHGRRRALGGSVGVSSRPGAEGRAAVACGRERLLVPTRSGSDSTFHAIS